MMKYKVKTRHPMVPMYCKPVVRTPLTCWHVLQHNIMLNCKSAISPLQLRLLCVWLTS